MVIIPSSGAQSSQKTAGAAFVISMVSMKRRMDG